METGPTVGCCLMGHKDREELEGLLKLSRIVVTLKDYKMKIALGGGKVKKTSMLELSKKFNTYKEGKLLINGGSLSLPLLDHVKEKFGLKSVETMERMEKELIHLHDELVKAGLSSEDVTGLAKKDKKTLEKAGREMARLYSEHLTLDIEAYLIFVLFGTPPYFLACKKYAKKVRKFAT